MHSKSANHLAKMERFLKGHPKYAQLMRYINNLPKHLLPEGGIINNLRTNGAVARRFRKHVSLPLKRWNNPTKYVGSVAKQFNGRLSVIKYVGKGATYYVPATLGLISVAMAPPGMKMRTLFEEGFGVLGGAVGTIVGTNIAVLGAAGIGVLFGLCLGPFGMFVLVVLFATAGGIYFSERFKELGGGIYDLGSHLGSGKLYYSSNQVIESF